MFYDLKSIFVISNGFYYNMECKYLYGYRPLMLILFVFSFRFIPNVCQTIVKFGKSYNLLVYLVFRTLESLSEDLNCVETLK